MDKLTVKGTVVEVTPLVEKGKFKKRSVIVKIEGQYPQFAECEFPNEKEELLDIVNVGDSVEVGVNFRGREWISPQGERKIFMSLSGWKIEIK